MARLFPGVSHALRESQVSRWLCAPRPDSRFALCLKSICVRQSRCTPSRCVRADSNNQTFNERQHQMLSLRPAHLQAMNQRNKQLPFPTKHAPHCPFTPLTNPMPHSRLQRTQHRILKKHQLKLSKTKAPPTSPPASRRAKGVGGNVDFDVAKMCLERGGLGK